MRTSMRSILQLILMLLVWLNLPASFAQEAQSLNDQTRLIRIKKVASDWQGSILTLHARDENEFQGRLLDIKEGSYLLEVGNEIIQIPLKDVVMVSFKPGLPEIFLSIASAFLGSALMSGAITISYDSASKSQITTAALLGLLGGGLWGYSTFYESEVIHLE